MPRTSTLCGLALAALAAMATGANAQSNVQAGILECRGAATTSFILGSAHQLDCMFRSDRGPQYHYSGVLTRVGVDIGFTSQSMLSWGVFAPTYRIGPGDLAGSYGGVTAGAAVGIGANANALMGGSNNSYALQPLSFEGQTGLNVAGGIAGLELRPAEDFTHRRYRRFAHHHRHRG